MKELSELARLVSRLEDLTAACKRCGACQAVCPIFEHTRMEKDIARGKIAVLDGVMDQVVSNADAVLKRLDNCLLCGSCRAVCPNRVDSLKIFLTAKAILASYEGLSPAKKFLFRQILARPQVLEVLASIGSKTQPLLFKRSKTSQKIEVPRFPVSMLLGGRHLTPIAEVPFRTLIKAAGTVQEPDSTAGGKRVLFFTGCLIDKIFPQVADASIKALSAEGYTPLFLDNEYCCGIPALSSCDREAFAAMVRGNLSQIERIEFDLLVTACATCAFTIKKVWPMIWDKEDVDYDRIAALSQKTTDVTSLLGPRLPSGPATENDGAIPVTYHDPCHLKKSLGVSNEPRAIINANRSCRLVEMEESDSCCGMGGGFGIAHAGLSEKIGGSKIESIVDTGCEVVATACPACMIQIAGLLSKAGRKEISVKHVIELYPDKR